MEAENGTSRMPQPDAGKRQHISMMNDMERQKLLDRIEREEEEERREAERRALLKEKRRMSGILGLLDRVRSVGVKKKEPAAMSLEEISQDENSSANIGMEGVPECNVYAGIEPKPTEQESVMSDDITAKAATLEEAIARIKNDKYVFFYITPANTEYLSEEEGKEAAAKLEKRIEECGRSVWGDNFYRQTDGSYCVLLRDCRLNRNTLKRQGDTFLFLLKDRSMNGIANVCYGFAHGRAGVPVNVIIKEAAGACFKQKSECNAAGRINRSLHSTA